MTNFIFKSSKRLVKKLDNTPNGNIIGQLKIVQNQCRFLRQDMSDMKLMINRLLIDKHLQMQVDTYFDGDSDENTPPIEDKLDED